MPAKLFRVILPVTDVEKAANFYSMVLGTKGERVSPGRHYFDCGSVILACFSANEDGDDFEFRPNPDHFYFAVENLDATFDACKKAARRLPLARSTETQQAGSLSDPGVNVRSTSMIRSETRSAL